MVKQVSVIIEFMTLNVLRFALLLTEKSLHAGFYRIRATVLVNRLLFTLLWPGEQHFSQITFVFVTFCVLLLFLLLLLGFFFVVFFLSVLKAQAVLNDWCTIMVSKLFKPSKLLSSNSVVDTALKNKLCICENCIHWQIRSSKRYDKVP